MFGDNYLKTIFSMLYMFHFELILFTYSKIKLILRFRIMCWSSFFIFSGQLYPLRSACFEMKSPVTYCYGNAVFLRKGAKAEF